jgi:hypothetical protein
VKNLEAVSEIDYARLAAYIDGEGCIRLQPSGHKRRNRFYTVVVIIGQMDKRLTDWLEETFGGSVAIGQGSKYLPMYYWKLGSQALDYVLVRCMPYFIVKGEQVKIALEYRATVTDRTITLPQELIDRREELRAKLHQLKHGHKVKKAA